MSEPIPFLESLGEQLTNARVPRRRVVPAAVSLVAVVAVALGVLFATRPEKASARVDIRRNGDRIELRLYGGETRAAAVQDAIHRYGLHVDVQAVPVGPSLVGAFVGDAMTSPLPEFQWLDASGVARFAGFSVPVGWPGHAILYLGRRAHHDEHYKSASNAFARGEPLACSGLFHARGAEAVRAIHGVHVRWQAPPPGDALALQEVTSAAVRAGPYADYRIAEAVAFSPTDVVVVLTPDGTLDAPRQAEAPAPC